MSRADPQARDADKQALLAVLGSRPIVLVGMMGAGKTTVGRRLAARLDRRFVDSDEEIEHAAGMSIDDLFRAHGEPEFRAGEARVVARLLREDNLVIATGGGAFMNAETRAQVREWGISVWLKAEFELLFARVSRRSNRPLLKTADPRATLRALIEARYPVYAEADVAVLSTDVPQDQVASEIISAVLAHLTTNPPGTPHD